MRTETFTGPAGQRYQIRISGSDAAADTPAPVIWLLDAPITWPPFHQAMGDDTPAVTVVTIDWDGDGPVDRRLRFRDFTTPPARPDDDPDAVDAGGAEAFRSFLLDTLRPALTDSLPSDALHHCLLGHSLSGLFVLDTLLARADAFDRYIALSPSLWWNEAVIVERARAVNAVDGTQVFMRAGLGEQTAGPEKPASIDGPRDAAMLGGRQMVGNMQAFAAALVARGMTCDHDVLPDIGHHGMLAAAMPDALRFACRR